MATHAGSCGAAINSEASGSPRPYALSIRPKLQMTRGKQQTKQRAVLQRSSLALTSLLLSSLISVGCTASANDDAKSIIEAAPVKVEAEQVMLAPAEVDCGVHAELWGPPTDPNQGRSICPLMDAGRALHFDD